jgi:hypothetical protein
MLWLCGHGLVFHDLKLGVFFLMRIATSHKILQGLAKGECIQNWPEVSLTAGLSVIDKAAFGKSYVSLSNNRMCIFVLLLFDDHTI